MKNENNKDETKQKNNPQEANKHYPGYPPDPHTGTSSDEFIETNVKDNDPEERLADTGPVRNPNYHPDDAKTQADNNAGKTGSYAQKTLEDYNKTDPKRDINQQENTDENGNETHRKPIA